MASIVANKKVDDVVGSVDPGSNHMLWNQMGNALIVNHTPLSLAPLIDAKSNVTNGLNASLGQGYPNNMKVEFITDKNDDYSLSHDGKTEVTKKECYDDDDGNENVIPYDNFASVINLAKLSSGIPYLMTTLLLL